MAETTVSLILKSINQASGGIKSVTGDIKAQAAAVKQLQAAEAARVASQKASLAQSKLIAAQDANTTNASLKNQKALEAAQRATEAATNRSQIAQAKLGVTIGQSSAQASRAASAMQAIGSAGAAAGSIAASGFNRLLSTLTSIATAAGAAGLAVTGIATAGVVSGLKGAMSIETENVLAKGNIASALGGDRVLAGQFQQMQNSAIASSSGGLLDIGTSKEFANIFADDIVKAFGVNQSSAQLSAGMANQLSALTTLGGNDKGQFKNVIGDFINGALTDGMLAQRDVLGSSGLLKPLKDELDKTGKSIQDLSPAERIQVLDKALKRALTPDTLAELADTAQGQMSVLKNRLFGEQGIFSMMRDTLPTVGGEQNVFEQFKNSLKLLFHGETGMFAQLDRILKTSGINIDVVAGLRNNWERFNGFLSKFNDFLSKTKNVDQLINNLQWELAQVGGFTGLGQKLGDKINQAIEGIDAKGIGTLIANGFNFLGGLFDRPDKGMIIRKIGEGLQSLMGNLTWQGWATSVGLLVGGPIVKMVTSFLLGAVKQALTEQIAAKIAAGFGAGAAKGTATTGAAGAAGAAGGGGVLAATGGVLLGGSGLMLAASQIEKALAKVGSDSKAPKLTTGSFSLMSGNAFGGAIDLAQAIGPQDRQKVINALVAPFKQLIPIAEQSGMVVRQIATESAGMIQQSATSAGSTAQQKWSEISNTVSTWANNTWSSVQTNSQAALTWAQTKWSEISTTVSTWAGNTWSSVQTNATNALTWAQTKWTEISTAVSTWAENTRATIAEKTASMLERASSAWEGIKSTISSLWDQIKSVIESAKSAASNVDLGGAVSGLMSAIQSAIESAKSSAQNWWNDRFGGGGSQQASFLPSAASEISYVSTAIANTTNTTNSNRRSLVMNSTIQIFAQPGQDVRELARLVVSELEAQIQLEAAAYG